MESASISTISGVALAVAIGITSEVLFVGSVDVASTVGDGEASADEGTMLITYDYHGRGMD